MFWKVTWPGSWDTEDMNRQDSKWQGDQKKTVKLSHIRTEQNMRLENKKRGGKKGGKVKDHVVIANDFWKQGY